MTNPPTAGERLGPYRLVRRIGEGGMGVVYLALDAEGREVAVKKLHPSVSGEQSSRRRLAREVESMRRIRSRHVAEVLDADVSGASPYIVTRFVPGRTLEEIIEQDGPLSSQALVRLARGLAGAIVAIHTAGVIHRDLKPGNVMLLDGEPLVIDFGIAHLVDATRLTATGFFVGTPGYLAPEVIRDGEVTQAADVHAFAATMYYAATGRPPFGTGSFNQVCYNIMQGRADLSRLPGWLLPFISSALALDPTNRPVARALARGSHDLDPAITPPPTRQYTRVAETGSYSDILTPVEYARPEKQGNGRVVPMPPPPPVVYPPPGARPPGPPVRAYPPPQHARPYQPPTPRYRAAHPLLSALLLTCLVALTCALPVIFSIVGLFAVVALRVTDRTFRRVADRRQLRGASGADPLLVAAGLPWAVVRSSFVTLLVTPLAAIVALIAGVGIYYADKTTVDRAVSLAAGVFVAGLFLLPGGGSPRKAVARVLSAAIPSRNATIGVGVALGAVTFLVVAFVAAKAPSFAPWDPPSVAIRGLRDQARASADQLIAGLVDWLVSSVWDTIRGRLSGG